MSVNLKNIGCKYFSSTEILTAFLRDVRRFELLTPSEEEELVRRYKSGDKSAKDELVNRNLRFIYSLAKMYARDESEVVDYVNEGVIGFITAMDTYNISLGYRFITYAVWYIRRSMNYYLNETRNMITRTNNGKLSKKIEREKQRYYAANGRDPSIEELQEIIKDSYDIDIKDPSDVYDLNIMSINCELDDDYTIEDNGEYNKKTCAVNEYEENLDRDYSKAVVDEMFNSIPDKYAMQKDILKMSFGVGYDREYSLDEIGEKYHIRVDDVKMIRDKMLGYMKTGVKIKKAL